MKNVLNGLFMVLFWTRKGQKFSEIKIPRGVDNNVTLLSTPVITWKRDLSLKRKAPLYTNIIPFFLTTVLFVLVFFPRIVQLMTFTQILWEWNKVKTSWIDWDLHRKSFVKVSIQLLKSICIFVEKYYDTWFLCRLCNKIVEKLMFCCFLRKQNCVAIWFWGCEMEVHS